MASDVTVVRPQLRTHLDTIQTPGMHREEDFFSRGAWVGVAHTLGGVTSGWHHHGDYNIYVYISSGEQLVEFGRDGRERAAAASGDVIHVGKQVIHRESNPSPDETLTFVVRVGTGRLVTNVDSP